MAYYRKRGNTWSFTVDLGRKPDNSRNQVVRSGYKTKKEAEKACAEIVTEYERGNLVTSAAKDTIEEFIKDYLENTIKNEVGRNTYVSQRGFVHNHIIPKIGKIKLQKLSPMDIQRFYNSLMEDGISPGTIHNIGNLLGKTLRVATEWGFITKNVASVVKKPSYKQPKMNAWTKEEMEQFLDRTRGSRFHVLYLIALTTGMRVGEICALSWGDVDMKNKTISINKTVVYADKDLYIKESPKTDGSNRSISIPDFVVNYLKRHKLEQMPNRLNLIVPGIKHEIVYNSALSKVFVADIKSAEVPKIRIHDMRHTHATLLLQMGENIKVVSERLGHATITTTLNTYAHVLPNMQKTLADNLEKNFNLNL